MSPDEKKLQPKERKMVWNQYFLPTIHSIYLDFKQREKIILALHIYLEKQIRK
jgi:hypothetical protein